VQGGEDGDVGLPYLQQAAIMKTPGAFKALGVYIALSKLPGSHAPTG
jgi:hypothetical protein